MITSNDFKTGITIKVDNTLYQVVEFLHVKPGKGAAFVRTKLKNVMTGGNVEKTFRAGEKIEQAMLERRDMAFLYAAGEDEYVFMDNQTYDQISLPRKVVGESNIQYLKENMVASIMRYEGKILMVDIPTHVELEVVDTPPSEKGNTASGGSKPAKLETGATDQVPFFIGNGDKIRVDTRNNSYIDRV